MRVESPYPGFWEDFAWYCLMLVGAWILPVIAYKMYQCAFLLQWGCFES